MKLVIALATLALAVSAHAKSTSEYTNLSECKTIASSENDPNAEIDYFQSVCKGRDGYKVLLAGGDSRSWVQLLAKGDKISNEIGFAMMFDEREGYFPNVAGNKLEWRYTNGKLNALIVRVNGQDPDDYNKSVDTLVVIRVDAKKDAKGCVIDVVNARQADANAKARISADSNLKCK